MPGRVVVTDSEQLLEPGIRWLRDQGAKVTVLAEGMSPADIARESADADVLLIGLVPFGADEIAELRSPGLLVRCGIGWDIIDLDAATRAGIWVANVPDYCVDEVADHTLTLLLAAWRRLPHLAERWRDGEWLSDRPLPPVHRASGRTLGVVGLGRIGSAVARRASAFGWRIRFHDPHVQIPPDTAWRREKDIGALVATCDALTLHCPLSHETEHLVDDELLGRARPGLVLVNTSRGGLVDLDALERALECGQVAAAGLDVLEGEPTPDLTRAVFNHAAVLVTPHLAWYSLEAHEGLALAAAERAWCYLTGARPPSVLNPHARDRITW